MPEPRDPLLKVLIDLSIYSDVLFYDKIYGWTLAGARRAEDRRRAPRDPLSRQSNSGFSTTKGWRSGRLGPLLVNDPSAGSPTETLLRLLLPLNDQV